MAKRFFNTNRIEDDWYINLSCKHRELLRYCESKCDGAGVFSWNAKIASTYIGEKITDSDLDFIPVQKLKNGKYFITGFCQFQNGELSRKSPAHNPIFKSIEENEIPESVLFCRVSDRVSNTMQEKEIVKEKEKEKELELELVYPFSSEKFKTVWSVLINEPKWKKKTKTALQASLMKLSKNTEEDAIQMIENSIAGGWQGLFELKEKGNGKQDKRSELDTLEQQLIAKFGG